MAIPIIERMPAPLAKKWLADLKKGKHSQFRLSYPSLNRDFDLENPSDTKDFAEALYFLMDSDLGVEIEKIYGKHDGVVEGKYRRAQVYTFLFQGEIVAAVCEKGDRGSHWIWSPSDSHDLSRLKKYSVIDIDSPCVIDFWPSFLYLFGPSLGRPAFPIGMLSDSFKTALSPVLREELSQSLPCSLPSLNPKPRI